jgi:hypothetical protein
MKTDAYTKVVLTGIAIFLGVIAFDYKPSMKAEAGILDEIEMIAATNAKGVAFVWHLKNGKVRVCKDVGKPATPTARCGGWE